MLRLAHNSFQIKWSKILKHCQTHSNSLPNETGSQEADTIDERNEGSDANRIDTKNKRKFGPKYASPASNQLTNTRQNDWRKRQESGLKGKKGQPEEKLQEDDLFGDEEGFGGASEALTEGFGGPEEGLEEGGCLGGRFELKSRWFQGVMIVEIWCGNQGGWGLGSYSHGSVRGPVA